MNKQPTQNTKSRIPMFASYEAEAQFWDTHDTTDFEDEFKPVKVRVAKNLSEGITVRFDDEILKKVRALAQKQGIGPTTLIRMVILKYLQAHPKL